MARKTRDPKVVAEGAAAEPAGPQVLRVPLTVEWSAAIRDLCSAEKADITQREALDILAEGCGKAITSGGLARAIVTRKIAALQGLLGRPALVPEPMPRIIVDTDTDVEEEPDEWAEARSLVLEE